MSHVVTVRLSDDLMRLIEEVRDPDRHPTLSDFVRRAVERYAMEIRRHRLAEECRGLASEDLSALAEADIGDYAERMARAERGEL